MNQTTANSLSAKIDALDLDEAETAMLISVLRSAESGSGPEVQGHFYEAGDVVPLVSLSFKGVKCDVHPWTQSPSLGTGSRLTEDQVNR